MGSSETISGNNNRISRFQVRCENSRDEGAEWYNGGINGFSILVMEIRVSFSDKHHDLKIIKSEKWEIQWKRDSALEF